MRTVPKTLIHFVALTMASTAWAAGGDGLKTQIDDPAWARWQARLALGTTAPLWRAGLSTLEPTGLRINTVAVSGDYYLTGSLFERTALGGLRATSAMIVGPRSLAATGQPSLGAKGNGFAIERRLLAASSSLRPATWNLRRLRTSASAIPACRCAAIGASAPTWAWWP